MCILFRLLKMHYSANPDFSPPSSSTWPYASAGEFRWVRVEGWVFVAFRDHIPCAVWYDCAVGENDGVEGDTAHPKVVGWVEARRRLGAACAVGNMVYCFATISFEILLISRTVMSAACVVVAAASSLLMECDLKSTPGKL